MVPAIRTRIAIMTPIIGTTTETTNAGMAKMEEGIEEARQEEADENVANRDNREWHLEGEKCPSCGKAAVYRRYNPETGTDTKHWGECRDEIA
jgi:uncharacterized OB-fold protein